MATVSDWLVSTIIWILCSVTLVPFFTALFLYRYILSKVVPLFNTKIHKIVSKRSVIYLQSDVRKQVRLGVMFGLEGRIELEDLRTTFLTQVVEATDANKRLLRPELRQFPVQIGGYPFWQWEENFDVKEHIHEADLDPTWFETKRTGQEVLDMVEEKVLRRSWVKGQSPWELLLIHNFADHPVFGLGPETAYRGTLVILHMSHVMGDGFTIGGLCDGMFGNPKENQGSEVKGNSPNINIGIGETTGFIEALRVYFFGIRNIILATKIQSIGNEVSPVKSPKNKNRFNMSVTPTIPVDLIKSIKRSQGVSFTAVLVTLIAKSYVKLLRNAGSQPPQFLPCFSVRGRRRKILVAMRNDMTMVQSQVPLFDGSENSAKMFKAVHSSILHDLESTNPGFVSCAINLSGLLWTSLREKGGTFPKIVPDRALMGFTNVAVTKNDLKFRGVNRLRTIFGAALTRPDGHGIICLCSSSNDAIRLVFQIGNQTVPEEFLDPEIFTKFFLEELEFWSGSETLV